MNEYTIMDIALDHKEINWIKELNNISYDDLDKKYNFSLKQKLIDLFDFKIGEKYPLTLEDECLKKIGINNYYKAELLKIEDNGYYIVNAIDFDGYYNKLEISAYSIQADYEECKNLYECVMNDAENNKELIFKHENKNYVFIKFVKDRNNYYAMVIDKGGEAHYFNMKPRKIESKRDFC